MAPVRRAVSVSGFVLLEKLVDDRGFLVHGDELLVSYEAFGDLACESCLVLFDEAPGGFSFFPGGPFDDFAEDVGCAVSWGEGDVGLGLVFHVSTLLILIT